MHPAQSRRRSTSHRVRAGHEKPSAARRKPVDEWTSRSGRSPAAHAAGDTEGQFNLLPGATDGGFSRITEQAEAGSYVVNVFPLDDVLAVAGQRLAIKIDVEGFEYKVLRGMKNLLRQNKCLVQIECFEPAELMEFMRSEGYRLARDFLPNYVFEN